MNKLLVVDEHRYFRTPDGLVWIPSQNDYNFWKRYLNVFDKIKVVSRIEDINEKPNDMLLSSGPNVEFYGISNYIGPYQYALKIIKVRRELKNVFKDCTHAIFRLPSELSFNIYKSFKNSKKPFAVEVLIDPWDALAPNVTKSIVRPLVRKRWYKLIKRICMEANGAAYVTERALQKRYPCKAILDGKSDKYFTANYSSIEMDHSFLAASRKYDTKREYVISHVGTMHNYIKGQDVLLQAIKIVRDKGYDVKCVLIGDGRIKGDFIKLVSELNIETYVEFTGQLKGSEAVREQLLKSDMLVFPTKAEGLPRVIIEAMGCALPCISTPVNGTPELLTEDFLVDPSDFNGFAEKIIWLINNPQIMTSQSIRNRSIAENYTSEKLMQRRTEFYQKLLNLSGNL